jgi:Rrf2 family protein
MRQLSNQQLQDATMLRLSKKADYALIAMKHLATRSDLASASAREIAEHYDIPIELMAKVLQRLARRGLVTSHQGTRGGYRLARGASAISVADIIQAIDGPLTVTACSTEAENCDQYGKCSVRDPLWRIKDRILSALATCSLQEVATEPPTEEPATPVAFTRSTRR